MRNLTLHKGAIFNYQSKGIWCSEEDRSLPESIYTKRVVAKGFGKTSIKNMAPEQVKKTGKEPNDVWLTEKESRFTTDIKPAVNNCLGSRQTKGSCKRPVPESTRHGPPEGVSSMATDDWR